MKGNVISTAIPARVSVIARPPPPLFLLFLCVWLGFSPLKKGSQGWSKWIFSCHLASLGFAIRIALGLACARTTKDIIVLHGSAARRSTTTGFLLPELESLLMQCNQVKSVRVPTLPQLLCEWFELIVGFGLLTKGKEEKASVITTLCKRACWDWLKGKANVRVEGIQRYILLSSNHQSAQPAPSATYPCTPALSQPSSS